MSRYSLRHSGQNSESKRRGDILRRFLPMALGLPPALALNAVSAAAQTTPQMAQSVPAATANPNNAPGKPFAETLRGNGTRAGYLLTHGNILPATVFLTVSGVPLHSGQDYFLDASTGALYLAQPARSGDSIDAAYRYLDGADVPASSASNSLLPGLRLDFGRGSQLGLLYNPATNNGAGLNISTYGLALGTKFGAGGRSSFNSLFYISDSQQSRNEIMPLGTALTAGQNGSASAAGSDHLFLQDLHTQAGSLQFHANYQDVGAKFNGFQALRANSAGDKSLLDRVGQLEAEKGVRRLGLGLGIANGGKVQAGQGLQLDWNQISDDKGAISQRSAAYQSNGFHLQYAARDVSDKFAAFGGLRESDKDQWQREKGLKTDTLGFGLNFGSGKPKAAPGTLEFQAQNFGDDSGSLHRQSVSLHFGTVQMQMLDRRSSLGFKRLNDLSDADKTALALDLYRQFDANAKAEQVTPGDKAQVAREAGLARMGLRAEVGLGRQGALNLSQMAIGMQDAGDAKNAAALRRNSLTLQTGALEFSYLTRRTDAGFSRIGDLSDVEKTYLALDVRRQFEPDATPAQVTPKEREQVGRDAGIARTVMHGVLKLGKGGKNGTFTVQQFALAAHTPNEKQNDAGGMQRQLIEYTQKNLRISRLDQTITHDFLRLDDLSDFERAQLGRETGLRRQQSALDWQIDKTTHFAYSSLAIGGTAESVSSLLTGGTQGDAKTQDALRMARAGLMRETLALAAQGLSILANRAETDKDFTRAADLALPEADRRGVEAERGFRRTDLTTQFSALRWLKWDGYTYHADDSADKQGRDIARDSLQITPTRRTQIGYNADSDLASADGKQNGTTHNLTTLRQDFGSGVALNLSQENSVRYDNGTIAQGVKTDTMRFQTADNAPEGLNYESRRTEYQDGKYENSSNLNIHVKPMKEFSFAYSKLDIDRGLDPSETTDKVDFSWQASKQFAVVGGFSQKNLSDPKDTGGTGKGDVNTVSVGLQGQPMANVTLAAKFDELHANDQNTRDTADISICNAKPIHFGPVRDLTITARYASLNDQRKLQNETMTGRLAWSIWKNQFVVDYSGLTKQDGSTTSRLYSFATDPNPQRAFHAGFLYKARTMLDGQEMAIRRFTADARLAKRTSLVYTYGTLPEDDHGNIIPQTTADVALKHDFGRGTDFGFFYRLNDNTATKLMTRSLGFEFNSQLSRSSKLSLAFSVDGNRWPDRHDHSHYVRIGFEQHVSGENYLTLSAEIRKHDAAGVADELRGNLDFHLRF